MAARVNKGKIPRHQTAVLGLLERRARDPAPVRNRHIMPGRAPKILQLRTPSS